MDALRWFAPNRYCTLPVPALRRAGLRIATEGSAPARAVVASDGQCAVAGFEFARRHRCPLLLYLWDLPPWRLGSGKPDLVVALAGRIRRFPRPWGGYPERRGYYSRIEYVARHAAAVWCPSTNTMNDVRNRFAVEAVPVPFCYDSDRFGPQAAEPRIIPAVPTILSISRLVPHKNHAVLLGAAAQLPFAATIRIIGRGPEAHHLRRLAGELGVSLDLSDQWATDQEIVAAYRSASVVVSASRFEGFGLTPIEGLAMGLPVIASDIPPHREFLDGRVRFFPPDDAGALATALEAVLQRPNPSDVHAPTSHPPASLTIDECARRFLPGLERLLRGDR